MSEIKKKKELWDKKFFFLLNKSSFHSYDIFQLMSLYVWHVGCENIW